jgi:hypothetical protein
MQQAVATVGRPGRPNGLNTAPIVTGRGPGL